MNVVATGTTRIESAGGGEDAGLAWAVLACSLVAIVAILAAKLLLVWRININWDEFNFLSHVHEGARGELTLLLQGAYTHMFGWIVSAGGHEADQVVAGRIAMVVLLALSVWLLWRLAAVWTGNAAAALAPVCYLSMSPVLKHGASFRYDSLLVPLTLAVLLLVAGRTGRPRTLIAAGICSGVAFAISIKAVFLVPIVAGLLLLESREFEQGSMRRSTHDLAVLGIAAGMAAFGALFLHSLTLAASTPVASYAGAAARTALIDVPFFARSNAFHATRTEDSVAWMLILLGGFCAVAQRKYWRAALCALSLLPILIYRNAWPYYYTVMLAPACVLAAVGARTLSEFLQRRRLGGGAYILMITLVVALFAKATLYAMLLRGDDQQYQRSLIAAVHEVFPEPVPYMDHSGMIASFPKANFFMSTWGVDDYRQRGVSFVERAIEQVRPPLLVANRAELDPASGAWHRLLPRDRELIEQHYLPYWGQIRVAGAAFEIKDGAAVVPLPFPARYRLESEEPIEVDGVLAQPGAAFDADHAVTLRRIGDKAGLPAARGRLVIASAHPPPVSTPMPTSLVYSGL